MRISGSDPNTPGLNLLGSMSKVGERQSNLIFVYPLLFDRYIMKRWEMILRDFLTAQFISQIKISNVLNITQSAVQGYGTQAGVPYLNPAEILNQALSNNNPEYIAFLSAITAIGGVFIALYFSSLSAINATLYSTFSKNLRDLLYRDKISDTYIKILSS